jgi:hypothetical protein
MYEIKYVSYEDAPGHWAIFKDGERWSMANYRSEWEAIADVSHFDSEAGKDLMELHTSI